jgi:hypothetical protein
LCKATIGDWWHWCGLNSFDSRFHSANCPSERPPTKMVSERSSREVTGKFGTCSATYSSFCKGWLFGPKNFHALILPSKLQVNKKFSPLIAATTMPLISPSCAYCCVIMLPGPKSTWIPCAFWICYPNPWAFPPWFKTAWIMTFPKLFIR